MKKYFLFTILLLCGCSSFGRGVASAFLDNKKEDVKKCEIKGNDFEGINHYFLEGNQVKIMMIHGVGSHKTGYSTRLQENLAEELGLNVIERNSKKITLLSPDNEDLEIGTLIANRYQNEAKTKDMIFYELTWSKITQKTRDIISYDSSKIYAHKRAEANQSIKKFLNDTAVDPLIYLSKDRALILDAFKQADCWMLGYNWESLPEEKKGVCKISRETEIANLDNEKIVFITHSLGSRILIDGFESIVEEIKNQDKNNKDVDAVLKKLQAKNFSVFMMANQLPILQIGNKAPEVVGDYANYCKEDGVNYNKRVFAGVDIIAFSDPNDILSYDIPPQFVDNYLDSRICPDVRNVMINVSDEISAFGLGFVNPLSAHINYENDKRVLSIMAYGSSKNNRSELVDKKCSFIYYK